MSGKKKLSLNMTQEISQDGYGKFEWDQLENFFAKSLNQSQIILDEESVINDDKTPTANSLARELTKSLQANFKLKQDLDDLHCSFLDFKREREIDQQQYRADTAKVLDSHEKYTEYRISCSETKITEYLTELGSFKTEFHELIIAFELIEPINVDINNRIKKLEEKVTDLNQYGRRPTIELTGVSEDIPAPELEKYIALNILHPIGVNVGYWDVVAVHRLRKRNPNQPSPVVCRFVNRKHAVLAVKNRHLLKFLPLAKNVFITDNLCPDNLAIFDELCQLKDNGIVSQVWSYNGKPTYKVTSSRRVRGTRVNHLDDLRPLIAISHQQVEAVNLINTAEVPISVDPATINTPDVAPIAPARSDQVGSIHEVEAEDVNISPIAEVPTNAVPANNNTLTSDQVKSDQVKHTQESTIPNTIPAEAPIIADPSTKDTTPSVPVAPTIIANPGINEVNLAARTDIDSTSSNNTPSYSIPTDSSTSNPVTDVNSVPDPVSIADSTDISFSTPTVDKWWCDLCSRSFTSITDLELHLVKCSEPQEGLTSPTAISINSILSNSSPVTSISQLSRPASTSSTEELSPVTTSPQVNSTLQPVKVPPSYLNSTSSDPQCSELPEVDMNVSEIKDSELPSNETKLHPLDDPVFMENMKSTYKSLQKEYLDWSRSPSRKISSSFGI